MKLKQARELINSKILDEMYVDYGHLVTDEEFHRKGDHDKRYEERAVERLLKEKVDFFSNCNIVFELISKIATFKCPSCGEVMERDGGSGSGEGVTVTYQCKCKICFSISLYDNGLSFKFPKEE